MRRITSLATLALLAVVAPVSAQSIDTRTGADYYVNGGFIFGQSFTTGSVYTQLDDFSFWVKKYPFSTTAADYSFRTFLYAFSGAQIIGPALFESAVQSTADGLYERTFSTGGVQLDPGSLYLAFIWPEASAHVYVGNVGSNSYSGGAMYYASNSLVTPSNFNGHSSDLMFTASFSDPNAVVTVPEPMSLLLLGTGIMALGFVAVRRREDELEA